MPHATRPLCGACEDGWIVDPDTRKPVRRCPCRIEAAQDAQPELSMQAAAEAHPKAMAAALAIIRDVALTTDTLSSNSVRSLMTIADVPGPVIGAAFRTAQSKGWITVLGAEPSTQDRTHSHRVLTYRSLIHRGQVSA